MNKQISHGWRLLGVRRRRRSVFRSRRRLTVQKLEDRRLLAAAEGDVFTLPRQSLDTVGLDGTLAAAIDWGDGTQTNVSLGSQSNPDKIRFKFDYSLDTRGFFSGQVRTALEQTGRALTQYFTDQLSAISPSGPNTWTANICHPSAGAANLLCPSIIDVSNRVPSVAANEIVVFAGARDIIGNVRGVGGPGGFGGSGTPQWLDTVAGRGQAGALQNPQTDFGVWGGSISFDSVGTDWYFDRDISGIGEDQIDFRTVAAHELMHVLGFGFLPLDKVSSWERLTTGSTFNGTNARNAYSGSGFPPIDTVGLGDGPAKSHWAKSIADAGQPTLMNSAIDPGARQDLTRLDLAALDDIGWQVTYPSVISIDSQTHVYGDDGDYDVKVVLTGSTAGQVSKTAVAKITNVKPTLSVPSTQTVVVGETLSIPNSLFTIADPGFGTGGTNPSTAETFTYSIDWKDGSALTTGTATITQVGNANRDTLARFGATHTYLSEGNFRVAVTVTDDDGGSDTETFTVQVVSPPALSLQLSKSAIAEDAGADAAVLTVTRSGPTKSVNQTISLASSDETEATVPRSIVILAGETSATAAVAAKDDALLDGTQSIQLSASGTSLLPGEVSLNVTDAEALAVVLSAPSVLENDSVSVTLKVSRSNTDTQQPLSVSVSGGDASELNMPNPLIIQSGKRELVIQLDPINDTDPEPKQRLTYTFTAAGYQGALISFDLLDDEIPLFQNPVDQFDANNNQVVSAGDALRVINEIGIRGGPFALDPQTDQPNGVFLDVTGDYLASALDALRILNEVARRLVLSREEPEFVSRSNDLALPIAAQAGKLEDDGDEYLELVLDTGRIF